MSALTYVSETARRTFLFRLYKFYVFDSIVVVKKFGFKELVRRRGLKFLVLIAGYYLIRDTLIYIVVPMLIARGIL